MSPTVDLSQKKCEACDGIAESLTFAQAQNLMPQLDSAWEIEDQKLLKRTLKLKDFYQTMAFVNAVAWIANSENHHPDIELGYNYCTIRYFTHALDGLTHNDFICSAKIDKLFI